MELSEITVWSLFKNYHNYEVNYETNESVYLFNAKAYRCWIATVLVTLLFGKASIASTNETIAS